MCFDDLPILLGLFFGDGHTLPGGLINVVFGFDVHLEGHDTERLQRPGAALLDALKAALRSAHDRRRGQAETEGCPSSSSVRTG